MGSSADGRPTIARGAVAVCLAIPAAGEEALQDLRHLLDRTESSVPIVLAGSPDALQPALAEARSDTGGHRTVEGVETSPEADLCEMLNAAVRAAHPADVVLLAPGVRTTVGWLARLRAAAAEDSIVASATPMSLGGLGLELPAALVAQDAGFGHEDQRALEESARRVGERVPASRPRIATIGPCAYVRRSAWDLAGPLEVGIPLDRALARSATRASALGMIHVLAGDVLVATTAPSGAPVEPAAAARPSTEMGADGREGEEDDLQATISADERGPLRRAVDQARVALGRLSVTIDARSLTAAVGGTQTYVSGLVLALAQEEVASVRVLVAHDLPRSAAEALTGAPGVELLSYDDALRDPPLSDVVHRPQQVFTPEDLALLRLVGRRVVIGQQDLIAYHNHAYHPDVERWRAYRRTTRLALAAADQVVFFSEHARRDAFAEDLVEPVRAHVVGIGVERAESPTSLEAPSARAPEGLAEDDSFLLCLGTDYAHKNRPFAIELLRGLLDLGWEGRLVLAGAHVPFGSSRERERELLGGDPRLASRVIDLGPVEDAQKQWLYERARALLYPTLYEGFGLIPLEAARSGLPCLYAAQASLLELAAGAATLVPWDAEASARAVLPLLSEGPARDAHLSDLRAIATPSWSEIAQTMFGVYEQALLDPAPAAAPRAWQELDRERYIVALDRDMQHLKEVAQEYQDLYHALEERVRFGLPLIDRRDGLLSLDQQRALMRVAGRGRLGAAALAPLALLGRGRRSS